MRIHWYRKKMSETISHVYENDFHISVECFMRVELEKCRDRTQIQSWESNRQDHLLYPVMFAWPHPLSSLICVTKHKNRNWILNPTLPEVSLLFLQMTRSTKKPFANLSFCSGRDYQLALLRRERTTDDHVIMALLNPLKREPGNRMEKNGAGWWRRDI